MWLAGVWGVTMIGHVGLNCIYPCVQKFKHPIQSAFFLNLLSQITRKLSSSIPFSSTLVSKNQKTFFLSLFQMCVLPLNALYPFLPTPFSSFVFYVISPFFICCVFALSLAVHCFSGDWGDRQFTTPFHYLQWPYSHRHPVKNAPVANWRTGCNWQS